MKRLTSLFVAVAILFAAARVAMAEADAVEAPASATSEPSTHSPGGDVANDRSDDPDSANKKKRRQARRVAFSALFVLVLLGFGMIAMTWLGFRMTRRYMFGDTGSPVPNRPSGEFGDDWAKKPLPKEGEGPDDPTGAEA